MTQEEFERRLKQALVRWEEALANSTLAKGTQKTYWRDAGYFVD